MRERDRKEKKQSQGASTRQLEDQRETNPASSGLDRARSRRSVPSFDQFGSEGAAWHLLGGCKDSPSICTRGRRNEGELDTFRSER